MNGILKEKSKDRLGKAVRPVEGTKSPKESPSPWLKLQIANVGAFYARERELGEEASVEGERDKVFTVWPMRVVNGNCQGRPVRPVGQTGQISCPLAAKSLSPKAVSL